MKSVKTLLILILALFAAQNSAFAQSIAASSARIVGGFDFINISINGAATVYSVAHDAQGMAWVGTEKGLYSFDGYNSYAHFTTGKETNSRVHSLLVQGDRVYIGSDAGFFVYDIRHDCYLKVGGKSPLVIRSMLLIGRQLMLGGSEGLFSYDLDKNTIQPTRHSLHNIYSLLKTPDGLLVGTVDGLFRVKSGRLESLPIVAGRQPLVNAMIRDEGRKGFWIGTEGTLYFYDGHRFREENRLRGNSIKSLAVSDGDLFAGTDNGLYIIEKHGQVAHTVHDSRRQASLSNNIIWSLTVDEARNLWLGTDNKMAILPQGNTNSYTDLSQITGSGDGNFLHSMLCEADGTVWMGGTNGLIRFRQSGERGSLAVENVAWYNQNSTINHIPHNRVRRIYSDSEGTIIVCTDHGLNIYDRSSGRFRNVIVTEPSGRYTTAWAYDVIDDGHGRYWIGSYMGGVFVINRSRLLSAGASVVADRHFSSELTDVHVSQMTTDGKGNIIVLYNDKGIDSINPSTMQVANIMKSDGKQLKLLLSDGLGNVWTVHDKDLKTVSSADGKSRSYHLTEPTASSAEGLMMVENDLYVVAGTECCVFHSDGSNERFTLGGDFSAFAGCYSKAYNAVLFGGNDGFIRLQPKGKKAENEPRLLLSNVLVNGEPLRKDSVSVRYSERLLLSHDAHHVSIRLSDMPFTSRQHNVYAYRLEGVSNEWQYLTDSDMEINYNGLPHGNYRLTVCTVDGEGMAAAEVFAIDIRVLPPWYLTVWAKLLYLVLIIALVVWALNFYMMRKRLAVERHQRQSVLQQSQARVAFFANLSRQLKAPIGQIMSYAYQLLPEERDSQRYQMLEQMRRSSTTINQLVGKAFDFTNTESRDDKSKPFISNIDIVDFCRRMTEDLHPEATKHHIEIVFKTDSPSLFVRADMVRLQPLVYALARHAVSLVPAGEKLLLHIENPSAVSISLCLQGVNISEEAANRMFYRYNDPSTGIMQQEGEENELAKLKEYVENDGGTITVYSDDEGSTTFRLSFAAAVSEPQIKHKKIASTEQESPHKVVSDTSESRLLSKITSAVEAHIDDTEFNVSRLQEVVGIGEKLLYRRIKQTTGKTPVEFIRHIRMQRAAILLREGRFSVSEVMYMVGFSNSSYFSKCFLKTFGITPNEYSKKSV